MNFLPTEHYFFSKWSGFLFIYLLLLFFLFLSGAFYRWCTDPHEIVFTQATFIDLFSQFSMLGPPFTRPIVVLHFGLKNFGLKQQNLPV